MADVKEPTSSKSKPSDFIENIDRILQRFRVVEHDLFDLEWLDYDCYKEYLQTALKYQTDEVASIRLERPDNQKSNYFQKLDRHQHSDLRVSRWVKKR